MALETSGLIAQWQMTGQVVQKRELTSEKNKTWRGHVVKVMTMGLTIELNTSKDDWDKIAEGSPYTLGGHFEDQRGTLKLIVDRVSTPKAA